MEWRIEECLCGSRIPEDNVPTGGTSTFARRSAGSELSFHPSGDAVSVKGVIAPDHLHDLLAMIPRVCGHINDTFRVAGGKPVARKAADIEAVAIC